MKIIDIKNTKIKAPTVVTVGNFDGVHIGHTRLLNRAVAAAREVDAAAAVVTFVPHTRAVIYPELSTKYLSTFEEKAEIMKKIGIDYVFRADFDENFRNMTQEEFIKLILVDKLNAAKWVMGEGHRVGKKSDEIKKIKKNMESLGEKYYITILMETLDTAGEAAISSTRIRALVSEGRMAEANAMLGRPYLITAARTSGVKIAAKLGFPTINFEKPSENKVLPPAGVYAAVIEIDESKLMGALYFGNCPTYKGRETHFEFHALEFDKCGKFGEPKVGECANLHVHEFIRTHKAFDSEDALAKQIGSDIAKIKNIFGRTKIM